MKPLALSCVAVLFLSVAAYGQNDSLRGLSGFRVVVEDFNSRVDSRQSLSVTQVQTDVELRLRRNGIRVLTEGEWLRDFRSPVVYINLNLVLSGSNPTEEGLYAYNIDVEVQQGVLLKTSPAKDTLATTWDKGSTGTIGSDNLEILRNRIGVVVDFLINDYLAANPRSVSKPAPH